MASSESSICSARKLLELTENENWKTNFMYHLTADPNYVEFLDDDCTLKRKTVDPRRTKVILLVTQHLKKLNFYLYA